MPAQLQPTQTSREPGFSDWIDRELVCHATSRKQISDIDLNHLLELRDLIERHDQLEPAEVIHEFFRLRNHLEPHFYLLCYRLRNWLNVFYQLELSDPLQRAEPSVVSLDLRFRDFGRLLNAARNRFFELAKASVSPADIRIKVDRRQSCK